jgi:hypothetical protein
MKITSKLKLLSYCLTFTLLFLSCKKELLSSDRLSEETYATQAIRKIVGSKGEIKLITSKSDLTTKTLTLAQLQNILIEQNRNRSYQAYKSEFVLDKYLSKSYQDQTVIIKSLTEFEDDIETGPRPAGYYHVQFSASSPLNQDLGGFYTLHLYFNTDANGRVIGNPSISYTGVGLFSWQQVNISNISFNANSLISSFTISGTNTYGIQVGGMTLGWSAMKDFLVVINLNELSSKLVTLIEQQ